MKNTGNIKSIKEIMEIIKEGYVSIPLIQRNYKWTMECASELAEDLWNAYISDKKSYMLNMITIYNDGSILQILDGQQRLITLKLFLAFLDRETNNINFLFERDEKIDERKGRRYFIDYILKENYIFQDDKKMYVDVNRLYNNFISMIIPISFRSIYMFYEKCLDKAKNVDIEVESIFKKDLNKEISNILDKIINIDNLERVKEIFNLEIKEIERIFTLCKDFNRFSSSIDNYNYISNDEIRVSKYSYEYQKILNQKIFKVINEIGLDNIILDSRRKELAEYIKEKVEMLYHETISKPIEEFLNINENKTLFVISDYIRANMISDNPINGDIDEITKNRNQYNRNKVLNLFTSLSNYLYNDKYIDIWNLIKTRYDDFEKYPDINRLKVLFCDKYLGTSVKGYSFEEEIKRLEYFNMILKKLSYEVCAENIMPNKQIIWNTYNAVYMLLECKKDSRFFTLFTQKNIDDCTELENVVVKEKFCFFEKAYEILSSSSDFWDISYFLESQLYTKKCTINKSKYLPVYDINKSNINKEWFYINRGEDELYQCIAEFISSIKEETYNGQCKKNKLIRVKK